VSVDTAFEAGVVIVSSEPSSERSAGDGTLSMSSIARYDDSSA